MRILFVLHERNLGGASRSAVTLMTELKERGHEVYAVLPIRQGQVYPKLKELGIPTRVVFFGWQSMPAYWNGFLKAGFRFLYATEDFAVRRIMRIIRRDRIQIVHSNSSVIDAGARAACLCGVPHVWHIREYGDLDYRLEFLKGNETAYKAMASVPGKLIYISSDLRRHYAIPLPEKDQTVIYNGVAETYCIEKERPASFAERKIRFLISGNLQRPKGQMLALKACQILSSGDEKNFSLTIAGGPTALADSHRYEQELKDAAAALPEGMVRFLGYCADMKSLREEADVELVCSEREAFGRVTVEAMLASNPVIGSDTGATPELIEDGKTGYLFRAGDDKSLADCMKRMIEDPNRIAIMGKAAQETAKMRFLSKRNTDQIEQLYQDLLTVSTGR